MKTIPDLTERAVSEIEKSVQKLAGVKYRKTGLPFVTLKLAQTLDGKIATSTGDSRWISGPSSLRFAHRMRSFNDAVLVGVDTIVQDDPRLTVRRVKGKNPQKIIVDSRLRTPLDSNLLKGRAARSTIIATTSLSDPKRVKRIKSTGAGVWITKKDRSNRVDLRDLLKRLGQKEIRSLLVEGGSKMCASFLKNRLADRLFVIIAPRILGRGVTCVRPPAPRGLEDLISVSACKFYQSGDDVIVQASINK